MANPLNPRPFPRGPIVDKDGNPSPWFQKTFNDMLTRSDKTTTNLGEIQAVAPITGRVEGIATTVGNIDAGGVALPAAVDLSRAYVNKNLDNVPDGTRAAWTSGTQKTAAVDVSGNLLLKNIVTAVGTTASPSTASGSFSVIPEMTQTITTKGNKVLCIFNGQFSITAGVGDIAIFRDGVQISIVTVGSGASAFSIPLSVMDVVAAGSHTYDVRWFTNGGGTLTSSGTNRTFQVVELG